MKDIVKTINNKALENIFKPYPEPFLVAWKSGDYSMLTNSKASDYIKDIIIPKAKKRPGRRFFGEAYIASTIDMIEGWYNSFKWVTSDKWLTGKGLDDEFEKPFYKALMKYVGKDILSNLQGGAKTLFKQHKDLFEEDGVFKKPVAPDLWLIDKTGHFKFIESKLPGDTIGRHQIAGLALIKKYIGTANELSVSIVNLYPDNIELMSEFSRLHNLA